MGGYIAAGGHSPLSSMYGMAADHVRAPFPGIDSCISDNAKALSMEVVLANGTFTTASADSNPDLFWALRGGGGSKHSIHLEEGAAAY